MIHLSQTNTRGFDELVFDHRNQAYGAYVLRKEYPKQVLKSLLIGIAMLASILAIPYLAELFKKEKVVQTSVPYISTPVLKDIKDDKKDEVKPPQKDIKPPASNTAAFVAPTVVTFDVDDTLPTKEDFEFKNPGYSNQIGDPNTWGIPCDDCNEDEGEITDIKKKTYSWVELEQKPEYIGGDEALREFLGNNLVYPEHAKQIGLEGKVYVTFVIDEFGNVTQIAVPREIGGGLDEEAIRVMQLMPRWKPGKQAGHPVRVSYQLPIIFSLN